MIASDEKIREALLMLARSGVKLLRVSDDFYVRLTRYLAEKIMEASDNIGFPANHDIYYTSLTTDKEILEKRLGNGLRICGMEFRREKD